MSEIESAIESFKELLDVEYEFVLGRKNRTVALAVEFQKSHFFHIAGLQHLKDLPRLSFSAEKIFDKIESGELESKYIESSGFYSSIHNRIKHLPKLSEIFESDSTIFKYNPALQSFSVIEADFLLKNTVNKENLFVFLSKNEEGKYFCRSFFSDSKKDYSEKQTRWTVLFKQKTIKSTAAKTVLFKHKNFKV